MNLGFGDQEPTKAGDIVIPNFYFDRLLTENDILDEIFGGDGLIKNLAFTFCAQWGSGKTTLMLQWMEQVYRVTNGKTKSVYISGEESIFQLAFGCKRLGVHNVNLCNKTDIDDIEQYIREYDIVVIDSFPTITFEGEPVGNGKKMSQKVVHQLIGTAKQCNTVLGIIMHMRSDGQLKGNTVVPHSVDATFWIEKDKETKQMRRIFSDKNRFGAQCDMTLEISKQGFNLQQKMADMPVEDKPNRTTKKTGARESNQRMVIDFISIQPHPVTPGDISGLFDHNMYKTRSILTELVNAGWLDRPERGKYVLSPQAIAAQEC